MNTPRNFAIFLLFATVWCHFVSDLSAAGPGFLFIEAIEGEAKHAKHENWIAIESLAFDVTGAVTNANSPPVPPQISEIKVTKRMDRSSLLLFDWVMRRVPVPELIIEFYRTQHDQERYLQLLLTDAVITGYETRVTAEDTHEIISLYGNRIEFDVRRPDGGTVRAYYDLIKRTGGEVPGEPPPENRPPTISPLSNRSVDVNGTIDVVFQIDDDNTDPKFLTVSAHSSNPAVVSDKNIVFSGTGSDRSARITPAPATVGSSLITFVVSDGKLSASRSFTLTVVSESEVLISPVGDVTVGAGETISVPFFVGHASADPTLLTVTAVADDELLVPSGNIVINGSGSERTAFITPVMGKTGSTAITLTVSDGDASATAVFQLMVESVSPAPVMIAPAHIKGLAGEPIYLTGISLADPSVGDSAIVLELSVPSGVLVVDTEIPGGVSSGQVSGNSSTNVSISASLEEIETTLGAATGISYLNADLGSVELIVEATRSGTSTATIEIHFYENGFALWQSDQFAAAVLADPDLEGTVWGSLASPAGDQIPNLVKYAIGLPAMEPQASGKTQALTIMSEGEERYLAFTIQLRTGDPALSCFPELSTDLQEWNLGLGVFEKFAVNPLGDSYEQVVYRLGIDSDFSNAFVRLRVVYDTN